MQHCPNCGSGHLTIIAAILKWPMIEKILTHLSLDPQPPTRGCARGGAKLCHLSFAYRLNHLAPVPQPALPAKPGWSGIVPMGSGLTLEPRPSEPQANRQGHAESRQDNVAAVSSKLSRQISAGHLCVSRAFQKPFEIPKRRSCRADSPLNYATRAPQPRSNGHAKQHAVR